MARNVNIRDTRSTKLAETKNYDLKLLYYMLLVSGFLLVQHVAADEFTNADNPIPTDETITSQDFSETSSEHDLERNTDTDADGTGEELRTNLTPDSQGSDTGEEWTEVDYDAATEPDDVSPLDWTTLDNGLQDLNSLINQIDENSQSQNESQPSPDDSEDQSDKPKYPCSTKKVGNDTNLESQGRIVNATELLDLVTSKAESAKDNATNITEGHCVFAMFYAPWCKFSAASAPHFNAVGRAFADIDVIAVDAFQFRSLNARYGTVSVPNFLFFYNSKPVLRYNYSVRTFNSFAEFLYNHTGLIANSSVNVSDIDYVGPVPSVVSEEPDYTLWFSGFFLLFWFSWVIKVQYGIVIATRIDSVVNYVRHIWRTGEFYEQVGMHEHEHAD